MVETTQVAEDRLKKVFSQVLGIEYSQVGTQTHRNTVYQWDSLRHVNLILTIQDEFNVRFSVEEMIALVTFSQVLDSLTKKLPSL